MITRDTILNIIGQAKDISISIYLPTHEKGEEVQQDPIRLKNLLRDVENDLADSGLKGRQIEKMLEEPRKLLDQPHFFWQHGEKGLVLFITDGYFDYFRVPLDFEAQYFIDNHFLVTPLLPMISLEGTYCILALSRRNVRLLKATRETISEFNLEGAPTSMEEFRQYDEYEKSLSPAPGGTAPGGGGFHGWGDVEFDQKEVENYLKLVENTVTGILKKRNDPLIMAGIDQAISLYRKVNHYVRLLEPVIQGNPDPKSDEELRDEGWEVIKSYFLRDMYEDMERFGNLTGSDKQSEDLTTIVESAHYGKVDSLFIPIGEQRWGHYDQEKDVVHHSEVHKNGEHDLINLAAIKTLSQGGDVYALMREEMPNKASIAAIFRY